MVKVPLISLWKLRHFLPRKCEGRKDIFSKLKDKRCSFDKRNLHENYLPFCVMIHLDELKTTLQKRDNYHIFFSLSRVFCHEYDLALKIYIRYAKPTSRDNFARIIARNPRRAKPPVASSHAYALLQSRRRPLHRSRSRKRDATVREGK